MNTQRELKFRMWSKEVKKFFFDPENVYHCLKLSKTEETSHLYEDMVWQQFTGLYDKNKKPIYEGDILKVKITDEVIPTNNGRKINACVRWDNFHAHWIVEGKIEKGMLDGEQYPFGCNENCYIDHHSPVTVDAKIIGNIFENSELLKQ